ncbi:MAG: NAD(P)H-hydrate dehydratase, partial [Dehalococcoidales bacterium]|nr:NAD(P)H-hydrate dehydratase [Dehalococcoidales bacterium]
DMKILTAEQMRQTDRACIEQGTPASTLMENAGKCVAEYTQAYLNDMPDQHVLCLIGTGNNGGDGLVAARYLKEWGASVTVYLCSRRQPDDENLKLVRECEITCMEAERDTGFRHLDELLESVTCVIDALLGTGKMRPLEGVFKQVLEKVNKEKEKHKLSIIAVDLPSGMDADTGAVDPACPYADVTVTLAFPKTGLYNFPGAARVGTLKIADIGIPETLADSIKTELLTPEWTRDNLPARPLNANKGTFGKALVVAGSVNYTGSAYLACSGAMRAGAGLVTLATAASLHPILASKLTETTFLPLPEGQPGTIGREAAATISEQCERYDALLLGCGLGQDPSTADFVVSLLTEKKLPPMVLDADALNILSKIPNWWQRVTSDAIITPHPGEMSRLCGLSIEEIQADRLNVARKYAAEWNKIILLKGAYNVIASPDGRCCISPFANPGLATAGTGDVLSGIIAGMLAQGPTIYDAARLGVYIGCEAGETIRNLQGDTGMLASDLLQALPVVIKQIKNRG